MDASVQDEAIETAKAKKRSRILRWSLIGALVIFVAGEVLMRVGLGLGNPPLWMPHSEIGYLLQANQDIRRFGNRNQYNQFHQRSDAATPLPETETFRVLMVGDSVLNGGVLTDQDETISEILERKLALRKKTEILAASAGSWGVENEYAYLKVFGLFGSQLFIWQIGSHDLFQGKSSGDKIGGVATPDHRPLLAWQEFVCRYVWPRVSGTLGLSPEETPVKRVHDALKPHIRDSFASGIELARRSGAQCLVVLTPDRIELTDGPKDPKLREEFRSLCNELKVGLVDLLSVWDGKDSGNYRDGVHLNPKGNLAAATVLEVWLKEHALSPYDVPEQVGR